MATNIADKLNLVHCPEDKKDNALKFAASLSLVSYEDMEAIVNYLLEKGVIKNADGKLTLPAKAFKILPRGLDFIKARVEEMEAIDELGCYIEDPSRINILDANLRLAYMKNNGEEYKNEKGKYSNLPFEKTEFIKKYGDVDLGLTEEAKEEVKENDEFELPTPPVEEIPLIEETPVEEVPLAEETPVEEIPLIEETPVEEVPLAEETLVEEIPLIEETSVEEIPLAEEAPVEEVPLIDDIQLEETVPAEIPAEEAFEETPVDTIQAEVASDTKTEEIINPNELTETTDNSNIGITNDEESVQGLPEVDTSILDFSIDVPEDEMVGKIPVKEDVAENSELTVEPVEAPVEETPAETPVVAQDDETEENVNVINIDSNSISTKVLENQARYEMLSIVVENLYAGLFNIEEVPSAMYDILKRFIEETTYEDADLLFQLLTGGSSYTPEEQGKIREAIEEQVAAMRPREAA